VNPTSPIHITAAASGWNIRQGLLIASPWDDSRYGPWVILGRGLYTHNTRDATAS